MDWSLVYKKAIDDNGELLFPGKLSLEFLDSAKRTLGSYIFANQYLNEIIPADRQTFKREWFRYYSSLPNQLTTFVFIDPALSEADTADNTGVLVVSLDCEKEWYIRYAQRHRISPTELISFVFKLNETFSPNIIGIEEISYQKALLYFLDEEMRRRKVTLPVKGVRYPNKNSKQTRILSLVPRFEFGHCLMKQGLNDLELELLKFPRGAHDDLIDALAGIEYIAYPPQKEQEWAKAPAPNAANYESYYIQKILGKVNHESED